MAIGAGSLTGTVKLLLTMEWSLAKTLRAVCYLFAACGLFFIAMPFIDVVLGRYHGPLMAAAGLFYGAFAIPFFFLSRCRAANDRSSRPVIRGVLWAGAMIFGALAVYMLYMNLRAYV